MKQNRALSTLLFGNLAREKRLGLAALAMLFLSIGLLVLSQRPWQAGEGPGAPQTGVIPTPITGAQPGPNLGANPLTNPLTNPVPNAGAQPGTNPLTNPEPTTGTATGQALPPTAPTTLAYPLKGESLIAQAYHSIDTAYGDLRYYDGVAWKASPGQGVRAAAKGRITRIAQSPGEGLQLWVEHGGGMVTRYGGLAMALVAEGAPVESGQVIGEVGPPTQIRAQAGPTLSFAVLLEGSSVDPNLYLRK